MARKIKRFFVFLFFSIFFSPMSGKMGSQIPQKGEQIRSSFGVNSAWAKGACCDKGICTRDDGSHYCC